MAWKCEFESVAERELDALDPQVARRILRYLHQRVAKSDNPRKQGAPMTDVGGKHWRYRVGDYRIITRILDAERVVVVVKIGHRRAVYRH